MREPSAHTLIQPPRFVVGNPAHAAPACHCADIGKMADPADIPPLMSARLARVLEIVRELEAHSITVQTMDDWDCDQWPTLFLDAGPELDGDESMGNIYDRQPPHPPYEYRRMEYKGVILEWGFEHPAGAGREVADV